MTRDKLLEGLPDPWPHDPLPALRQLLVDSKHTIIVLDDDPTGTQTVYDVPVITDLSDESISAAINERPPLLFLLTNSRALTADQTTPLHLRLGKLFAQFDNLTVISRSDSTLRGHYPAETDALESGMGLNDAVTLLVPFFEAGGRLTRDDQHVVVEGDSVIPASKTPFALDPVFGYRSSHLPTYVEEKTKGRTPAATVQSLPLEATRSRGPASVAQTLLNCPPGSVCIANAVTQRDVEVIAAGAQLATNEGLHIISRTAASYVQARAGLPSRPPLEATDFATDNPHGGLVIVGSHVPKTTDQLNVLLENTPDWLHLEVAVPKLLSDDRDSYLADLTAQITTTLTSGKHIVAYTSRDLVAAETDSDNLDISNRVSAALVHLVENAPRPRFLIGKGGITSSDLATKALQVKQATVLGAILPGIPVWKLGPESRHPNLPYIVFPGNTGGNEALWQATQKLTL